MALKLQIRFPIFGQGVISSQNFHAGHQYCTSEVRFSRRTNGNAEKFNRRRSPQKEILDGFHRDNHSVSETKIFNINENDTPSTAPTAVTVSTETSGSSGTASIPGKISKYSRDSNSNFETHPAFQFSNVPVHKKKPKFKDTPMTAQATVSLAKDGVSYVIHGAPFEFKYSYTETPKVEPLKLREPPFVPFGPTSMPRPWTGRAPLPPSKKKLREFDSFVLPPPHKKGVKPVQAPGPFLPGSGPKYVKSREDILGEPLTEEEVAELVKSCVKTKRQLNIGRDGLTHNMLDNIHAHWKRRRVCKIKCKGVCTVDMDNVCQQLEERTGGTIICRRGGSVYLFRGRNYNYRTRPLFPLMLWKPASPVYPRLIQRVPEGLTEEAVTEMRAKGRKLTPICKLGKNGVYCGLVKTVREAFEECELIRINCQGMNGSDFRKIGAKLRDLVPCVLISFQNEHILMWRGQNWKSSIQSSEGDSSEVNIANVYGQTSAVLAHSCQETPALGATTTTEELVDVQVADANASIPVDCAKDMDLKVNGLTSVNLATDSTPNVGPGISDEAGSCSQLDYIGKGCESSAICGSKSYQKDYSEASDDRYGIGTTMDENVFNDGYGAAVTKSDTMLQIVGSPTSKVETVTTGSSPDEKILDVDVDVVRTLTITEPVEVRMSCTEEVLSLLKRAIDEGGALVLDKDSLDADFVFRTAVSFSKSAPPGPLFRHKSRKSVKKTEKMENIEREGGETKPVPLDKEIDKNKISRSQKPKYFDGGYMDVVPQGSLRVDELAKLLG